MMDIDIKPYVIIFIQKSLLEILKESFAGKKKEEEENKVILE